MALLAAYSVGLALPFIAAALAVPQFLRAFAAMRSRMVWINRASGVLLVAVGTLMMTDFFTILAGYLVQFTPEALRSRI
jgi:cytochrome c-type biogenesis protein